MYMCIYIHNNKGKAREWKTELKTDKKIGEKRGKCRECEIFTSIYYVLCEECVRILSL